MWAIGNYIKWTVVCLCKTENTLKMHMGDPGLKLSHQWQLIQFYLHLLNLKGNIRNTVVDNLLKILSPRLSCWPVDKAFQVTDMEIKTLQNRVKNTLTYFFQVTDWKICMTARKLAHLKDEQQLLGLIYLRLGSHYCKLDADFAASNSHVRWFKSQKIQAEIEPENGNGVHQTPTALHCIVNLALKCMQVQTTNF